MSQSKVHVRKIRPHALGGVVKRNTSNYIHLILLKMYITTNPE